MDDTEVKKWLSWVSLTNIPMRQIGENNLPADLASGCLVDFNGKRFILSVRHSIEPNHTKWVIELEYSLSNGVEVYLPSYYNYLGEMKIGDKEITHLDVCYAEVPQYYYSKVSTHHTIRWNN